MVDWARFKPEVAASLPISVLCLALTLLSLTYPDWVTHVSKDNTGCLTTASAGPGRRPAW